MRRTAVGRRRLLAVAGLELVANHQQFDTIGHRPEAMKGDMAAPPSGDHQLPQVRADRPTDLRMHGKELEGIRDSAISTARASPRCGAALRGSA